MIPIYITTVPYDKAEKWQEDTLNIKPSWFDHR